MDPPAVEKLMRAELLPSCLMLLSRDSETRLGCVTDQGSVVSSNPRLTSVGGPAASVVVVAVTSEVVVLSVVVGISTVVEIDTVAVGSCDEVVISVLLSTMVELMSTAEEVSRAEMVVVVTSSVTVDTPVLLLITVGLSSGAEVESVVVKEASIVVDSSVQLSIISEVSSLVRETSVVKTAIMVVVVSSEMVDVSVRLSMIVELISAVEVIETAVVIASSVVVFGSTLLSITEEVRAKLEEVSVVEITGAEVVVVSFDSVDVSLVLSDWSVVKIK